MRVCQCIKIIAQKRLGGNRRKGERFMKEEEKLKRLEAAVERLRARQEELSEKLEQLRLDGRKNSYQFRELMGEKLNNATVLAFPDANDLL